MRIYLSVIIPHHKESFNLLETTIKKIRRLLNRKGIVSEIIISQNGSLDKISLRDKNIVVLIDSKRGLGLAIKNAVRKAKGKFFYFLPADIPFNFIDLNHMLKERLNFDLILGSKLHPKSVYRINFLRKIYTLLQQKIVQFFLPNFPVKDPNGTYFGNLKKLKKTITSIKSADFFFGTELVYKTHKEGMLIKEVPVVYIKKSHMSSVNIFTDGVNFMKQLIRLAYLERKIYDTDQ